jgi:hypothetical protein
MDDSVPAAAGGFILILHNGQFNGKHTLRLPGAR